MLLIQRSSYRSACSRRCKIDVDWNWSSLEGTLTINSEQFNATSVCKTLSTESEGQIDIEYTPDGFNDPDGDFYVKYSGDCVTVNRLCD